MNKQRVKTNQECERHDKMRIGNVGASIKMKGVSEKYKYENVRCGNKENEDDLRNGMKKDNPKNMYIVHLVVEVRIVVVQ